MLDKDELIAFEREVAQKWEAGKLNCPIHLSGGNEDQLIQIFKEIKPNDYVFSTHRNHYHALLHGVPPKRLMDEILGKSDKGTGCVCKGRARSMGFIDHSHKFYSSAIVGGNCAPAVGVAWALKEKARLYNQEHYFCDEAQLPTPLVHVWCFVGDGTVDGGHFWEALQYAEGWDLPITFVVENNNRATCTDVIRRLGPRINDAGRYCSSKSIGYQYDPTWPHVGTGKYVQF